ncbi:MAG: diacylglycerol kinase [Planctomycetaceae bacterium]|nr:diacylglycerol kinase [Planctomycetaceae bacterium]
MPATLPLPTKPSPPRKTPKRRAQWRQRLRDSESGVRQGVRSDSSFAVHFFLGTVVATAAFVLNFTVIEWAVLILAFTTVLSAEMFHQLLKTLWEQEGRLLSTRSQEALRIGTAAVMVTIAGSLTVSGLLFARRIMALWAE